ncbi:MAG: glycosyltransferase family 2 protein [Pseudohongiella sp.]|nr:glycosyltransferase family 2 protein [Pseudohongiella sp.]
MSLPEPQTTAPGFGTVQSGTPGVSTPGAGAARVCAIVVTWQPDLPALHALLESLLKQACPFIVVDNGSANIVPLRSLLAELAGIYPSVAMSVLVDWDENKGLAEAMNEGLRRAQKSACSFVLLFDQDSQISTDFVTAMLAQWDQLQALDTSGRYHLPPAAIGPRLQDPDSGRRTPFRCFRWTRRSDSPVNGFPGLYETDFLISSGTLISMPALETIGLMKDEYFIDNIDLEWCFRARAKGFSLYGTDRAILFHRIGESSPNPLVRSGIMVHHSPLRSYYSTRNRMHLWRQPYAPRDWKMRDMVRFLLKSLWLISFTKERKKYRQEIQRGMDDAETLL